MASSMLRVHGLVHWGEDARLICRREHPHPGAQLSLFDTSEDFKHTCFITNAMARESTPTHASAVTVAMPASGMHVGSAVLEISAVSHTGCAKFRLRYGVEVVALCDSPTGSFAVNRHVGVTAPPEKVAVDRAVVKIGDADRRGRRPAVPPGRADATWPSISPR